MAYQNLPLPGFYSPVNKNERNSQPKCGCIPTGFNFVPTQSKIRLVNDLFINACPYHYQQNGTKYIIEYYFNSFVQDVFGLWVLNFSGLQSKSKIILGVDPGTVVMGYSIISVSANKLLVREIDCVRFSTKSDAYVRLHQIHDLVCRLIREHRPAQFAIEAPFFGKNVQSMLKLGRAQGVAIAAAMQNGLTVCEYSPRKIKQSITGNGNASKEQVLKMLQTLTNSTLNEKKLDASDALAVAVCHHFQDNPLLGLNGAKIKDWKDFVAKNPTKVS